MPLYIHENCECCYNNSCDNCPVCPHAIIGTITNSSVISGTHSFEWNPDNDSWEATAGDYILSIDCSGGNLSITDSEECTCNLLLSCLYDTLYKIIIPDICEDNCPDLYSNISGDTNMRIDISFDEPAQCCDNCIDEVAPKYVTVIINGVSNNNCNTCSDINGTYELELKPLPLNPDGCFWQYVDSSSVEGVRCDTDLVINLSMNTSAGVGLNVTTSNGFIFSMRFRDESAYGKMSPWECFDFSSYDVVFYDNQVFGCDGSTATVTIISGTI